MQLTKTQYNKLKAELKNEIIVEITGLKTNQLPVASAITASHLFIVADSSTGIAYQATKKLVQDAIITFKTIELTVGDPTAANPAGSPTPAAGALTAVLNYKVLPNSEAIFYQSVPVRLAPSGDFNYTASYGATTTTYTFSLPLIRNYVLKFNVAISIN